MGRGTRRSQDSCWVHWHETRDALGEDDGISWGYIEAEVSRECGPDHRLKLTYCPSFILLL